MRNPLQANGIQRQRLPNFQSNYLVINAIRGLFFNVLVTHFTWLNSQGFAKTIRGRFGAAAAIVAQEGWGGCRGEDQADYNYIVMQITDIVLRWTIWVWRCMLKSPPTLLHLTHTVLFSSFIPCDLSGNKRSIYRRHSASAPFRAARVEH